MRSYRNLCFSLSSGESEKNNFAFYVHFPWNYVCVYIFKIKTYQNQTFVLLLSEAWKSLIVDTAFNTQVNTHEKDRDRVQHYI
jgi:hypothetical protein